MPYVWLLPAELLTGPAESWILIGQEVSIRGQRFQLQGNSQVHLHYNALVLLHDRFYSNDSFRIGIRKRENLIDPGENGLGIVGI